MPGRSLPTRFLGSGDKMGILHINGRARRCAHAAAPTSGSRCRRGASCSAALTRRRRRSCGRA
eukprot:1777547-Prymnesium_polylepis.1